MPHVIVVAARLTPVMGPDTIRLLVITALAGMPVTTTGPEPPPEPPFPVFATSFQLLPVYSSMPPAPSPATVSVITPPPGFNTVKGLEVWNASVWPGSPVAPSTFKVVNTPLSELKLTGCAFKTAVMGDVSMN